MNSQLYGKTYKIPSEIINQIKSVLVSRPNGKGVKRAKFIVNNGQITYQAMKRIKNFFDTFDRGSGDRSQYELAGGDLMKNFIDKTLAQDRGGVERSTDTRVELGASTNKIEKIPKLNENDAVNDAVKKNAIGIVVNNDKQILLLKRAESNNPDVWQPGKWSLVGGGVENGEDPVEACKREIKEETDLDVKLFSHKYIIQRSPDSIEYIYVCKYDGDNDDIILDTNENSHYGWFFPDEMKFLSHVPNLMDYINIAFKEY